MRLRLAGDDDWRVFKIVASLCIKSIVHQIILAEPRRAAEPRVRILLASIALNSFSSLGDSFKYAAIDITAAAPPAGPGLDKARVRAFLAFLSAR